MKTKCKDCLDIIRIGCYCACNSQKKDVLMFPCGKVGGYSKPNVFWTSSIDAWWRAIDEGSIEPPEGTEWCDIDEVA